MVSIAPLRFGGVFAGRGGPIARTDLAEFPVQDRPHWLANAFLREELAPGGVGPALNGPADGTAIARSAITASRAAIAAALARWAYLAVFDSPAAGRFGFHDDGSSTGMAAFPGLFRRQAQSLARAGAIRHYALVSWWDGRLPAEPIASPYPRLEALRLHHDAGPGEVVMLFRRSRAGYAYGHAYGPRLAAALDQAAIELARAEQVLANYRAKGALAAPANFLERRMLHFAGEEGAERFCRRVLTKPAKPALPFRTLFDGEIPGPWARWATVWRCCARMPTDAFLEPAEDFFFW